MPEGVSGIEDLKVMIAADSEKLGQGLAQAKDIIAKFADATGVEMGRFGKFLDAAGTKVDGLEKRLVGFIGKAQSAWSNFDRLVGEGAQYAAMAGLEDSYKELTDAWGEFKSMADTSIGPAFDLISGKAVSFATELSETYLSPAVKKATADTDELSESLAGPGGKSLLASMERARDGGRSLSKVIIDEFAAALKLASAQIDSATKESADRQFKSLNVMEDALKRTIAEYERAISEAESKSSRTASVLFGAGPDAVGGSMLSMSIDDARRQMEKARTELSALSDEIDRRKKAAQEVSPVLDEWVTWSDEYNSAVERTTESLKHQVLQLERQARAIGMTTSQRTEFDAFNKVLDQFRSLRITPTDEDLGKLRELASIVGRQAEETKRLLDAEKQRDGVKHAIDQIDREVEALRRRAEAIGMTAAQRAEFEAINKARDALKSPSVDDLALIGERAAALRAQAEETNRLLDIEKQREGLKQITNSMERELDGMQRRILLTREAAGAAEEMAAREKALTLAQQRNIELSPEMIASIDAYAARIGAAARELDAMKKQLDLFKETGQLVARSLEGAFRQWTEGSKVDVREMVRSMLADLAMLTFRKNVSDVLGGGITSGLQSLFMGGGGGAAIAGAGGWSTTVQPAGFLDGLLSGFRADGGPVEAGRMYMVGERGPEPFIPKVDGTILPSGSRLGGQQITIATTINAPGASPEAAAMIERRLAEHEARMPGVILEVTREARERGIG